MQEKEICRMIDKNPEESNWKSNLPPLFSVEMFADSVVGLRAKLAKSKEVTELTCLNLFCARFCLANCGLPVCPRPPGWLGAGLERDFAKKKLVNSRRWQEEPDSIPRTAKPQSADDLIFAQIRDSRLESGFVKSIWMSESVWFWSLVFNAGLNSSTTGSYLCKADYSWILQEFRSGFLLEK